MKEKKKIDKSKVITKIIASVMVILMLAGIFYTLIYYMIRMF